MITVEDAHEATLKKVRPLQIQLLDLLEESNQKLYYTVMVEAYRETYKRIVRKSAIEDYLGSKK